MLLLEREGEGGTGELMPWKMCLFVCMCVCVWGGGGGWEGEFKPWKNNTVCVCLCPCVCNAVPNIGEVGLKKVWGHCFKQKESAMQISADSEWFEKSRPNRYTLFFHGPVQLPSSAPSFFIKVSCVECSNLWWDRETSVTGSMLIHVKAVNADRWAKMGPMLLEVIWAKVHAKWTWIHLH